MQRKLVVGLMAAVMSVYSVADAAITGIEPEIPSKVDLSLIDVNRIVCPGKVPVRDVVFSKEKGLIVKPSDDSLFVKFPVTEIDYDGKTVQKLFDGKAELYITCGSSVYTLILSGRRIPAQTVYLSDSASSMKKANDYISSESHDDLMLDLIQALTNNMVPKGFTMEDTNIEEKYKGISVTATKAIEGGGFRARELVLKSDKQVSITDTELLKLSMLKNVKAIGIMSPVFAGVTTAYVVEGVVQ